MRYYNLQYSSQMLLQYTTGTSKLDIIEMYDSTRDSRKQKHSKVLSI